MRAPPHLPFLTGPPDFTVGLKPIALDRWLTPDWEADTIPAKRALIASGADVTRAAPTSADAQAEVGVMIADAVGAPPFLTLLEAAHHVSDDLVLLQPVEEHGWTVTAAVLCAPTYFSVAEAFGRSLWGLHAPVPDQLADGAPGLGARIARVFSGLRPGGVLERFNWTVQAGPDRFTPQVAPLMARAAAARDEEAAGLMHLRVERQTIRRLPASGAVLFTIRVSLDPLVAAVADPAPRAAFVTAWAAAGEHVQQYKRWPALNRLVLAALGNAPGP